MTTNTCTILNEAQALRLLDWPTTRRAELRSLADHHPCGNTRIYQRSEIELLRSPLNRIMRGAVRGAFAQSDQGNPA